MDKQKEIEKMAKMQNSCWRISCEKCIEAQRECDEYWRAELLVNQGYGNVRAAVKEFANDLQNAIVINELIRNKDERMVVLAEIDELVKEVCGDE